MMKGKIKYFVIIFISIFAINITNVKAAIGGVVLGEDGVESTTNCDIKYTGTDANGDHVENQCHKDYDIEIDYNGQSYKGYCGDLNKTLDGKWEKTQYTCENADAIVAGILGASGYTDSEKTAALRDYTTGIGNNNSNANKLLEEAQNGGSISVTKSGENGNVVTYTVTTTMQASDITFTCGAGCSSIQYSGSTLTVTVAQGACSYSFTVSYPGTSNGAVNSGGQAMRCYSEDNQDIYILHINDSSSGATGGNTGGNVQGGKVTQSFSGKLENTGSAYYKEYCDEEDDKPNKCTEKTTFDIPSFCDDPSDKQIKITAPKDVQYCILNGKDEAGNTYKMAGQEVDNNPYCAVYCKEDYKMTMPGAQYTESGRYFSLHNTLVEAKRTCYATNPKGDSDNPQIDIDRFMQEIVDLQQKLIKAKSEYEAAKALANGRNKTKTIICNGKQESEFYRQESYTSYTTTDCDNSKFGGKGVCKITNGTDTATSPSWGTSQCSSHEEPKWEENMKAKEDEMKNLVTQIETKITHMENCYKWVNTLCLDTKVDFDYKEQYNTDINYTLVSGGGQFTSEDAKYHNQEKLPNKEYDVNMGAQLENVNYVYCDKDECNTTNTRTKAEKISTFNTHLYYRKIEVEGSAEYANVQSFQTNYPHGTIDTVSDPSSLKYNYSYLGAVFPVALNTKTGVYKWTLNFSNLGQYNDFVGCRNGRLDTVANALGKSVGAGIEYVCVYVVDCDDCDYECVGEGCYIPDQKCPECDVFCTNCIFDGDGDAFFYQVIGDDTNPNDRQKGANWTNEKGQTTLNEIESNGQNVYINAQYTYRMGPDDQKRIRDYNKQTGTYVAEDLNYHDVGSIKNAYGTSTFLDSGEKNGFFKQIKRNGSWTQWASIGDNVGPAWK